MNKQATTKPVRAAKTTAMTMRSIASTLFHLLFARADLAKAMHQPVSICTRVRVT